MAASRGQTPPVNLKERIAALQQRNVSPNTHQSAQAVPRGIPSPGSGGLRDKIAKFEEKGGMPVPRGSFAMGTPQLAENAPPRKRGELYANRVPGLGRPSVGSRPGSPLPPSEVVPTRKRCISTGTGLAGAPSGFSTDEPVPPLPNGFVGCPRRNSLAVDFSARRVADGSRSPTCVLPEKPPENEDRVEEAQLSHPEASDDVAEIAMPSPVVQEPLPTVDGSTEDPPAPPVPPLQLYDTSRNVSQSSTVGRGSRDHSEYESAPQSAVSQPSPSLSKPTSSAPSPVPADTLVTTPHDPAPDTVVVTPLDAPLEKTATSPRNSTLTLSVPSSTESVLPSIPTPTLTTPETRLPSKPTFKAVVHRKVTEPLLSTAPTGLAPPEVPQPTKQRQSVRATVVEVSASPGVGDLALLLEDAALLELRLTEGDGAKAKELVPTTPTPTSTTFQNDVQQTTTEHAPVRSSESGSQSVRSMSIPSIREPLIDGEIPEGDETDGRSLASTTFSQRSPSHRKYLANIYRLTGRRSSGYMPGAYPRDSMSMSSEDSSPVRTPSDNGKRKGFGIAWPSGSPKRSGPNVGRSSSFADKIFNRSRTKSNVSTTDQMSECGSLYGSSQPSLTISFPSELPEHIEGMEMNGPRSASWMPSDSNSEFSPASSLLDKDIFDAFPSVPQTLPPGFQMDVDGMGRANTLPVKGRKQVNQRLSMM